MSTFSLQKIYKTASLDAHLKLDSFKVDLMTWFKEINSVNPKITEKQIEKELS